MHDLSPLMVDWPVPQAAVGVTDGTTTLGAGGDPAWQVRIASISKVLVGYAILVAVEEETVALDEPAGPPGSTLRHLLAHASGLGFDTSAVLARPGRRRIYSNTGIEAAAAHLAARAGLPFAVYLHDGVLAPLGMAATELRGSPAHAVYSTVADLLRVGRELLAPTLVSGATLAEMTTPQFPALKGMVPGVGAFDPNPWGLAVEIRGDKQPHWTGTRNSPRTFGHFGGTGTFLWVDPDAGLAAVALAEREFDEWALAAWPAFSDAVLSVLA
jgi:CubicO group peptidase (beta-lactamase class C family)